MLLFAKYLSRSCKLNVISSVVGTHSKSIPKAHDSALTSLDRRSQQHTCTNKRHRTIRASFESERRSSTLVGTFATRKTRGGAPPRSIHAPVRRRRVVGQLQLAILLDRRQYVRDGEGRRVLKMQLREVLLQQG